MVDLPTSHTDANLDAILALVLADGDEALARAQAIAEMLDAAPSTRAMAWAVVSLVEFRQGDSDRASSALASATQLADGRGAGRLCDFLQHVEAQRLRHEGHLIDAGAVLLALDARCDLRPSIDAYLTLAALGIVQSMLGDDEAALDSMYRALHLARRSGVASFVVNALSNLGSFEQDLYNLEDATPLLENALAAASQIGSRRQLIFAAGNLVQCLTLSGDTERALVVAREQLIPAIHPDDPPVLRRDDEIAAALLASGCVDEAAVLLENSLYEGTLTNELATARVTLQARINLARGEPVRALAMCLGQLAVLQDQARTQVTMPIDHVALLRVSAEAAAASGQFERAYELLQDAFVLHERLLGRAARSRRLSLQVKHRLRQAEWERDSANQMAAALENLNASLRAEAAENERLKRQLLAHALEDPLTGLPNRRHLFDAARHLFALQARRGGAVAASLIDLDHFKLVNDRHGHDAGDAVLVAFADLLRRGTRSCDIACRYGGEEFVLLMADVGGDRAAERLRQLLESFSLQQFAGKQGIFRCSFSAGTVEWRGEFESLESLLSRADAALYDAKAAGRAAVCLGQ